MGTQPSDITGHTNTGGRATRRKLDEGPTVQEEKTINN